MVEDREKKEIYESNLRFSPDGANLIYVDINRGKYKYVKRSLSKKSIEQNSKDVVAKWVHASDKTISRTKNLKHLEPEITLKWMTEKDF
jgi:hypothetical protein